MKKLVSLTPHARGPPSLRLAINTHLQLANVKVKRGNKADRAQEQSTDRSVPFAVPTCITTLCCFEASWPAYAQGEAFVHLFTIICYERLSKAGERNPALWDKRPFVFNQSHGLNENMFRMTRVKWKGGLGSHSAFRNQIRRQKHCSEGKSHENGKLLMLNKVWHNTAFPIFTHGLLKFSFVKCPLLSWPKHQSAWFDVMVLSCNQTFPSPSLSFVTLTVTWWVLKFSSNFSIKINK